MWNIWLFCDLVIGAENPNSLTSKFVYMYFYIIE